MTAFSCVLIGNESLLIGCGDSLLDRGHTIGAVVTQDADITNWAEGKGLPVEAQIGDLTGRFQAGGFDWLLSIANLSIIPDPVLSLPARGARPTVNLS